MDGSKARRRGSYLVFGEIGHDLHGRDHRVTLDVVLLELGLGADVRDDLRGVGGKERKSVRARSTGDSDAGSWSAPAPRAHLARLIVETRVSPELLTRLRVHVVYLHGDRCAPLRPARVFDLWRAVGAREP